MKLQISIASAILALSVSAYSEVEVTGKYTYEYSAFDDQGNTIGAASSQAHEKYDTLKSEHSARIYLDGDTDLIPDSTFHVELQAFRDPGSIENFDSQTPLTQREVLREAYIDTNYNDWAIRAGKQQVVWGKADGMKLLDMINPTDFSEMAQNQMEDSRIPLFMVNAEKQLEDGGTFQAILSQASENKFAGLMNTAPGVRTSSTNKSVDQGHPFILKGIDTITGKTKGFLNIAPDMMQFAANMGPFAAMLGPDYGYTTGADLNQWQTVPFFHIFTDTATANSTPYYSQFVGFSTSSLGQDSAVMNTAGYSPTNPNAVFDLMGGTTAATMGVFASASGSEYRKNIIDDEPSNIAFKYNNTTQSGTNYSLALFHGRDVNPTVNVFWEDSSGNRLTTASSWNEDGANATAQGALDSSDDLGGYIVAATLNGSSATTSKLVFEETNEKITNIGGAFDHTIDTDTFGPVVIRGEGLYQHDVTSPVIDRGHMFVGDVANALKMVKGDRFKYVIGADITAMTNMMVSLQFIQDRNLDYVDEASTALNSHDSSDFMASYYSGHRKYTADMATMHITNNLQKAKKNKEFYTLYLSKPFGSSGQHRWNNLFLYEEGDGKWNKFDVEYALDDATVLTGELNRYFGDENTQFGQLKESSNVQVGLKYLF